MRTYSVKHRITKALAGGAVALGLSAFSVGLAPASASATSWSNSSNNNWSMHDNWDRGRRNNRVRVVQCDVVIRLDRNDNRNWWNENNWENDWNRSRGRHNRSFTVCIVEHNRVRHFRVNHDHWNWQRDDWSRNNRNWDD